jgi:hypothetical protein
MSRMTYTSLKKARVSARIHIGSPEPFGQPTVEFCVHVWDEIASMLKSSVPAVKKRFWRDIENAKVTLRIGPQGKSAGRAKVGRRNGGNGSAA